MLSGCSGMLYPQEVQRQIPSSLMDTMHYPELKGNYTKKLPNSLEACTVESKKRGSDVIALMLVISNGNDEFKAIDELQKYN